MTEDRKSVLKEILRLLHAGAQPQDVKEKFKQFLQTISPLEISRIEQELMREGMSREEIQRLCDVHMAVFREQLEKQKLNIPPDHPLNILMEEHKIMLQLAGKLTATANKIQQSGDASCIEEEAHVLQHLATDFQDSEKHYLREENVLFPSLEKHEITEPPAMMWMEHDQIREKKKTLSKMVENYRALNFQEFKMQLSDLAEALNTLLASHFFKENNILFPTALRVITENEWKEIRNEFDEIGYCCFTPPHLTGAPQVVETEKEGKLVVAPKETAPFALQFETGTLTKEEVEALFNSLPVDITFVDKDDTVRYFNKAEKRIFARTKAIIGRKVQLCHPQKSIHIVNRILDSFKEGKKDLAEFWINLNNRLILIRYFAVRDKNGKYLGTMEVTQDITDIKKIEGEKRLLDWKE